MKRAIVIALMMAGYLSSQDVVVKHLSPKDTKEAKKVYADLETAKKNLETAQSAVDKFKQTTANTYNEGVPNFSYSSDFTVIVITDRTSGTILLWKNSPDSSYSLGGGGNITAPILPCDTCTKIERIY